MPPIYIDQMQEVWNLSQTLRDHKMTYVTLKIKWNKVVTKKKKTEQIYFLKGKN
jgi:hypothetical protein